MARDRRFIAVHRGGPLKPADHAALARWAADCAERVLPLFARHSSDPRPGQAIATARAWADGEVRTGVAMKASAAAHAAARGAVDRAAIAAARAAGHAVATAHAADHSMGSLLYALKALEASGAPGEPELESQLSKLPRRLRSRVASGIVSRRRRPDDRFRDLGSDAWTVRERAGRQLFDQGERAVATIVAGAGHQSPRVRAACVELMDHLADERCCEPLLAALRDPSPLVRRHAVHAVGCQRCKVRPLALDVVDLLIERVDTDSSARVRRVAVHQLGLQAWDCRAVSVLTRVISESDDPGLVARATHALDEQRRSQPTRPGVDTVSGAPVARPGAAGRRGNPPAASGP
ncbi:MAG: HEAT repeat domain-containing protein [Planctomycetota bacterium]